MHTSVNRARGVVGDSHKPLAAYFPIAAQNVNVFADAARQFSLLKIPQRDRLYHKAPCIPSSIGPGSAFSSRHGVDYTHIRDDQIKLEVNEIAYRYVPTDGDEFGYAIPTMPYDTQQPHVPVLASVGGLPKFADIDLRALEADPEEAEKVRYRYQCLIEVIGIIVPTDSESSTNGQTVAHTDGPMSIVNTGPEDIYEGQLLEFVVLMPHELMKCRTDSDHIDGTRPVLVPRPYDPVRTAKGTKPLVEDFAARYGVDAATARDMVRNVVFRNIRARSLAAIQRGHEGVVRIGYFG